MEERVKFTPVNDRVLVEIFDTEDTTEGGIIIPEVAKEKVVDGIVRAVGRGSATAKGVVVPIDVMVGDHVVTKKYGGTEITIDGRGYTCVREDDILGVVG